MAGFGSSSQQGGLGSQGGHRILSTRRVGSNDGDLADIDLVNGDTQATDMSLMTLQRTMETGAFQFLTYVAQDFHNWRYSPFSRTLERESRY
jgi:hypothetical protein